MSCGNMQVHDSIKSTLYLFFWLWVLWVTSFVIWNIATANPLTEHVSALVKDTLLLMETLAAAGFKPGAFWLQDASCNLLATFTDSILAPRWRGSCFRRPWQRRERQCGWTSAMCLSRWTLPVTAPSSSSPWPSTTSLTRAAPSETGQQKVDHGSNVKLRYKSDKQTRVGSDSSSIYTINVVCMSHSMKSI